MGRLSFAVPDAEEERVEAKSDKVNLKKAVYVRRCFRAGEIIWENGDFDTDLLDRILTDDVSQKTANNKTPSPPTEHVRDEILRELPAEGQTEGVTEEELRGLIFGSKEEQLKYINKVCEELHNADKVTRSWDGGLVKKNE